MNSYLRLTWVAGVSLCAIGWLAACGSSDGGGNDPAGTGGSTAGAGGESGGNTGGATFGGSGGGTAGGGTGGGTAGGGSGGGTAGSGGGSSQCEGDFYLGQNAVVSGDMSTYGAACNSNAPTNCPDGTFIQFPSTGECICIVMCSSLQGVSLGDACDNAGNIICEKIEATNPSANSATVCVPTAWGMCTAGGGTGGTGGSGGSNTGGAGGGDTGGSGGGSSCLDYGSDCFDDEECCSGYCDSFSCG